MKKSGIFNQLLIIFQLVRIKTCLVAFIIAAGVSIYNYHDIAGALILGSTILFTMFFGYAVNEYSDYKKDILMPVDHVIPSGLISRRRVLIISCCCCGLSLLVTILLSPFQQVLNIILLLILSAYSYINNKNGIISNILVAICSFIGILITLKNFEWSVTFFTGIAFFLHILGREIILDIHDYEADLAIGKKSFPISFTVRRSFFIVIVLSIACFIYSAVIGVYFMKFAYIFFIYIANAIFLVGLFNYRVNTVETEYKKFVTFSRISFLLVIPAFFL